MGANGLLLYCYGAEVHEGKEKGGLWVRWGKVGDVLASSEPKVENVLMGLNLVMARKADESGVILN